MTLEAQGRDRGEQSLLELPQSQSDQASPQRGVGGAQSADARTDPVRAPAPEPQERPAGEPRATELPPDGLNQGEKREGEGGDEPRKSFARRHPLASVIGLFLFIVAAAGGYLYWDHARHFESTDDAFIAARQFAIAPKVSGYITAVPITDNQHVAAGDVVARIDERDYRIALEQARGQVAAAQASIQNIDAQINVQQAQISASQAQVEQARAALVFAQQQAARYQGLAQKGSGTVQDEEQFNSQLRQQQATLASAQANLSVAQRQPESLKAQRDSAVASLEQAMAQQAQAQLNLSYTSVTAAQPGRVVQLSAAVGQYAQAGTDLSMFVPDEIWVTANFKENQLDAMRPGQPVTLEIDAYPERTIHGHIASIQPGSGTAFSLLPAQNATGNYVKIVQRVPVKVVLDNPPTDIALGPGMSVAPTVRVDSTPSLYQRLRALL